MRIQIDRIKSNPNQVRSIDEYPDLEDLAASIRIHGLLQPIKVRPVNSHYELVYGHRRLAAMRLLKWEECEAIVEGMSDDDSLIQSIAENIQRQNLDVLDEGKSYKLLKDRGFSVKQIAEMVNKPQGQISNRLSILRLPLEVQKLVSLSKSQHATTTEFGALSADSASRISSATSHANEAISLANKVIAERLNSGEIRELTSVYKVTSDPEERRKLIEKPWNNNIYKDSLLLEENDHDKSQIPNGTLFHKKIVWNLLRTNIKHYNHFTIGYSERTIEQFIELLKIAKVTLLADVRRNPVSRFRPDFSKANLQKEINEAGLIYAHWPDLGIPSEKRRGNDTKSLFAWYKKSIKPEIRLKQYEPEIEKNRVAFMCVELDPESCHRHCISLVLEDKGYKLLDL